MAEEYEPLTPRTIAEKIRVPENDPNAKSYLESPHQQLGAASAMGLVYLPGIGFLRGLAPAATEAVNVARSTAMRNASLGPTERYLSELGMVQGPNGVWDYPVSAVSAAGPSNIMNPVVAGLTTAGGANVLGFYDPYAKKSARPANTDVSEFSHTDYMQPPSQPTDISQFSKMDYMQPPSKKIMARPPATGSTASSDNVPLPPRRPSNLTPSQTQSPSILDRIFSGQQYQSSAPANAAPGASNALIQNGKINWGDESMDQSGSMADFVRASKALQDTGDSGMARGGAAKASGKGGHDALHKALEIIHHLLSKQG
jgi:hypothetical protein